MTGRAIFLTHAEVEIDPSVPVPDWGLNATGHARHAAFAKASVLDRVTAVFSSTERKAREGAAPAADRLGLAVETRAELGENDRSATGFLPPAEFWPVVATFFSEPDRSVRGWETARAAQKRIVGAVRAVLGAAPSGDTLIVAHGGVGTLLWCRLAGRDIEQDAGQPHAGGGCWFSFAREMDGAPTEWNVI